MVSQLKRLKASLQSAGVTGPKPSSKKRKRSSGNDRRVDKNIVLQSIREEFNPFETKTTRTKHDVINARHVKGKTGKPGLSKSAGEEARKKTLLVEMRNRNKVGGIVDRRFGENDPTMDPEAKMLERFTRETNKKVRGKTDLFNLEDDDDDIGFGGGLTHFGQSLGRAEESGPRRLRLGGDEDDEDFLTRVENPSDDNDDDGDDNTNEENKDEEPTRKKTKKEVMKEVIAKSKLHKYERQKAKEEDQDEREKLDAQMGDLMALLRPKQPTTGRKDTPTGANSEPLPDRQALKERKTEKLPNTDKDEEGDYDQKVREMMFDRRSKPSERTKTAEERAAEESERLKELEDARQRRMDGMEDSDEGGHDDPEALEGAEGDDDYRGEAEEYGFGQGIPTAPDNPDLLVDGDYEVSEDGYVDVDDEGVVDGEISDDYDSDYSGVAASGEEAGADSEEDEFLADLMPPAPSAKKAVEGTNDDRKLAYTYPCPQTHKEMLDIAKNVAIDDLPTVVQRIRILHHPRLQPGNKEKLGIFSTVLLEHILYVADLTAPKTPFLVIDILIRHLHALSKTYPETVAAAFRSRLVIMHEKRTSNGALLTPGDLTLLTATATIFPASDHFHQVVTPAHILICKWLAQTPPASLQHLVMGTYLVTLVLVYQRLSKRYVPEAINYTLQGLCILSPTPMPKLPGNFVYHPSLSEESRLHASKKAWQPRKLAFADIFDTKKEADTPYATLHTLVLLVAQLSELWAGKPSFYEVFAPASTILSHLSSSKLPQPILSLINSTNSDLTTQLSRARLIRRPLELHHHRPLPIPSNYPKFEEGYNIDTKSYDPDPIRREQAKLKAEVKKERKGAMRELRKDSAFIARERLQTEKDESRTYWEKMRKVEAQVQTEEGAGKNEYERERKARARK